MLKKVLITGLVSAYLVFGSSVFAKTPKIGFIVKNAEQGWFQTEWRFAEKAAKDKGFDLIKIEAKDGEKLMSALDNLGAQQADGVVLCTPNVKLGHAIVKRVKYNNLKLLTVDDRLVNGKGKPIKEVPHIGISAYNIGIQAGNTIYDEMKNRHWNLKDVSAMALIYKQLPTAAQRTNGAIDALKKHGLKTSNIFVTPHAKDDTKKAFDAGNILIAKHDNSKKWIVFGMNDSVVIGGVRALESNGIPSKDIIAVGINGSNEAINEFKKDKVTGFYATIILEAKKHGYKSSVAMYDWIKNGKKPALLTYTTGSVATRANYKKIKGIK